MSDDADNATWPTVAKLICISAILSSVIATVLLWLTYRYSAAEVAALDQQLVVAADDKKQLISNLAAREVELAVLKSSQIELRQTIGQLQSDLAEQDKELVFYRQLMVSSEKKSGLDLTSYIITPTDDANVYDFRFTFVQYAKMHRPLSVTLSLTLSGLVEKEAKLLNFSELVNKDSKEFTKLKFKYFQVVEGQLTLPDNFVPEHIKVSARIKAKKPVEWQRDLAWKIENR